MLKRVWSWLGEKCGERKEALRARPPSLEPLEPRFLLNAEFPATELAAPLLSCLNEPASYADLAQQDGTLQDEDLSPILTLAISDDNGQADVPSPDIPTPAEFQDENLLALPITELTQTGQVEAATADLLVGTPVAGVDLSASTVFDSTGLDTLFQEESACVVSVDQQDAKINTASFPIEARGPPGLASGSLTSSASDDYVVSPESYCESSGRYVFVVATVGAPDLLGLQLLDPDVSNWQGQIIYLDFDGAENVIYNGPVTIGPFDVPAFSLTGTLLAGQEHVVIDQVLSSLQDIFAGSGVTFTTDQPPAGPEYSTIYIGGDGSWASEHGSFLGLAEQVDVGNQQWADNGFVFTGPLYQNALTDLIAHETGHLLGYEHGGGPISASVLTRVAYSGGTGTEADPYMISNASELQAMKNALGAHYALARNIDCSATRYWNWNATEEIYNGFEPVGDASSPFIGTFDGRGYVISDLYINMPTRDNVGLFGVTRAVNRYESVAEIKDVNLQGAEVVGKDNVGGLVGTQGLYYSYYYDHPPVLLNVYSTGNVHGNANVGGLVGLNYSGRIEVSYVTGDVNGTDCVGGLAGRNHGSLISLSQAAGHVSGNNSVGGLVGSSTNGTISQSYATGSVNGGSAVGGLVGSNTEYSRISYSYATGNVTGDDNVGGLAGYIGPYTTLTITNSYAQGTVNGGRCIGGLVGGSQGAMVSNSYSTGNVNGEESVGGLVGIFRGGTISNSYSAGNVNGQRSVGGLVGELNNRGAITNSYVTGSVHGDSDAGGIAGIALYFSVVSNCYYYSHAGNPSVGIGAEETGSGGSCTPIASEDHPSYFFMAANAPMDQWDFAETWWMPANDYPKLMGVGDPGDMLSAAADVGAIAAETSIACPGQIGDSSYSADDVDLFKFTLPAASTVTLDIGTQSQGSPLDAYLRLFDVSGREIAFNGGTAGVGSSVILTLTAGTYYVGVSGYPNRAYSPHTPDSGISGSTGVYLLSLSVSAPRPPPATGRQVGPFNLRGYFGATPDGFQTATGTIIINNLVRIVGSVSYRGTGTNLVIRADGEIWLDGAPVLDNVLIYSGRFEFRAGRVVTESLDKAPAKLSVGGLGLYLDSVEIVSSGVRLRGGFILPNVLGGEKVDFSSGGRYIDVTTEGLTYNIMVFVESLDLVSLPGIRLKVTAGELAISNITGVASTTLTGTFSGSVLDTSFSVDLSKPDNCFSIDAGGKVSLVGSLDVGKITFAPGLYAENLRLCVNTDTQSYYATGRLRLPLGTGVTVDCSFGILQGYFDAVTIISSDLDIPIWATPPVLLDKIGGSLEHLTPDSIDRTPPVITLNAGLQLGPDLGDYNLLYLDLTGTLDLAGKISGTATLAVGKPEDPIAAGSATVIWQWAPSKLFKLTADLKVGDQDNPLVWLSGDLNVQDNRIWGGMHGEIDNPMPPWLIERIKEWTDTNIPNKFSADAYFEIVRDEDSANDFIVFGSRELAVAVRVDLVKDFSLTDNVDATGYDEIEPYLSDTTTARMTAQSLGVVTAPMATGAATTFEIPDGIDGVMFDLHWDTGDTDLHLIAPDGTIYTPDNYELYPDVAYLKYGDVGKASFIVHNPQGGLWQVVVTEVYGIGAYEVRALKRAVAPTIRILEPAADRSGGTVDITWIDADNDSNAAISLYYDTDRDGAGEVLIASGISEDDETDSYPWDTTNVPAGEYYICAVIDDGNSLPDIHYSTGKISVRDPVAPAAVTGLSAPEGTETSVRLVWDISTSPDLDHYLVRLTSDAAGEGYQRVIGAWGSRAVIDDLISGETYRVAVAAVNTDGHVGPDSEPIVVVIGGNSVVRPAAGQWEVFGRPGQVYEAQVPGNPGDTFSMVTALADATLSAEGLFHWTIPADADGWQQIIVHVSSSSDEIQVWRYSLLVDSAAPQLGAGELQVETLSDSALRVTAPDGHDVSGVLRYQLERNGVVVGPWQISPVFTDTALNPNTAYDYRVQVKDSCPSGWTSAWSLSASGRTMAATPEALLLGATTQTTIVLTALGEDGNPAGTEYAVFNLTSGNYVAVDGSISDIPVWQTRTDWGGTLVRGLREDIEYALAGTARNADGLETELGAVAMTRTDRETVAPTVLSSEYVNTTGRLTIEFSEPVVISMKDIALAGADGQPVQMGGDTFSYTLGSCVLEIDLTGLAEGEYTLTIYGNNVTDLSSNLLNRGADEVMSITVPPLNHIPTLASVSILTGALENTQFTVTYQTLLAASDALDSDEDTIHFRIEAITGGTLTKAGQAVEAGTTLLSPGESLMWCPAVDAKGVLNAFTVVAWDGQTASVGNVQVRVDVAALNESKPVYRFWSPVLGHHFYTSDEAERDWIVEKYPEVWTYEGIAFSAFPDASQAGLAPVYRFWSDTLKGHFYTIDPAEKDWLIRNYSNVWTSEGVAFYAYPQGSQPADGSPVYRFWSSTLKGHFYTMNEVEKAWLIRQYSSVWAYEGVAWYAIRTSLSVSVDPLTTSRQSPGITGTVDDGAAAIDVTIAGRTYTAVNNGDGTWALAAGAISPTLPEGIYDVTVAATSAGGIVATDDSADELTILPPPPVPIDSLVRVQLEGWSDSRATGVTREQFLIENVSSTVIFGPVWFVVTAIDPGVIVIGSGMTEEGHPYIDMTSSLGDGRLSPGETATVWLSFQNPLGLDFILGRSVRGMLLPPLG